MALTEKQKIFADEYLVDLNATRAYRSAYPNCKKDETAAQAGSRMLRNVKVANYISERMKEREKRTEITQDRVLQELAKLAFFDVRNLLNPDGTPKAINELDDETAACIAGMDINDVYDGYGEDREFVGYVKKYKLTDKKGALELLGRHLGMFKDKLEISGSMTLSADDKRKLADEFINNLLSDE